MPLVLMLPSAVFYTKSNHAEARFEERRRRRRKKKKPNQLKFFPPFIFMYCFLFTIHS